MYSRFGLQFVQFGVILAVVVGCCGCRSHGGAAPVSLQSTEVVASAESASPSEQPSAETIANLQKIYSAIYCTAIDPLLRPEQKAKMDAIDGIRVESTRMDLTSIFVHPPTWSDRNIVIGYGGHVWCGMVVAAWVVEVERLGTEAEFIPSYLLYVQREQPDARRARDFHPYVLAGWNPANLNGHQEQLAKAFIQNIVFFVLAHEVGHVVLNHESGAPPEVRRRQETAADEFACKLFIDQKKLEDEGLKFHGVAAYLMASAVAIKLNSLDPAEATHPAAWQRIADVAEYFLEHADETELNSAARELIVQVRDECKRAMDDPAAFLREIEVASAQIAPESLKRTRNTRFDSAAQTPETKK